MAVKKTKIKKAAKKVSFAFDAPTANRVVIAGDFNNWDIKRTPLKKSKDNMWKKILTLKPGRYEYKFLIDGNWTLDPNNGNRVWNSLVLRTP